MRLIDASTYAERIRNIMACWKISPCLSPVEANRSIGNLRVALNELNDMPTIDAEPIKHGKWEKCYQDNVVTCSICGEEHYLGTYHQYAKNYCSNCGAKMDR